MILKKISIILILVALWGCSTKRNTWLSRNYHNLTAYYNVYFNGREAFNNGEKAIIEGYQNDYSNILPVFEASDPDAASIAGGDMDRAIEKGQKLIKKHSITAKPKKRSKNNAYAAEFYSKKEFNVWVDDAYVLIGKAQVYKHEQSLALRTLQQVVRDFPNSESMYEALIWQARAYTDKGDYIGAMAALESYDLGGNAPAEFYSDYMATYANLLMVQEKYIDAIPYLKNALTDEKNKHQRLRYSYILGQLYLLDNQRQQAAESFAFVAKASTDYEMTFNAKVNQASIVYANADIEEVKKQLHKLRKDKKNKDYLDRIYYAFGKVALQENDEQEALRNFKKSVSASINNENQKGLSYRESGEIYYSRMDYANAYFYYDSALVSIDEDYENIDELKERHYGLSGLVDHLLTVQREDSLQRLADMSEPVLYAYLDDIIAEKEAEQKRLEKLQKEESMSDAFFYQNAGSNNTFGQSGKWYFYNQNSMGMGKMEFEKRWGKRKLEDNWRRKDKSKVADEQEEPDDPFALPDDPFAEQGSESIEGAQNEQEQNATVPANVNVPTREQLLADIPLTEQQRKASDEKIEEALLEQGLVFMDRLENYPKSIEALEDLLSRYPQAESRDEALIALYNAYRLNGDNAGMLATKNRIEQEFPNHRFVAYLNDPDFIQKIQDKKAQESKAYEATYEAFLFGRFDEVIANSNIAIIESSEDSKLTNKYYLLRALSYGKKGDTETFKSDLNTIVKNDKESEEAQLAEALLKHLSEGKAPVQGTLFAATPSIAGQSQQQTADGIDTPEQNAGFVYVEAEPYELIVMGIDKENINRAIYNVADYNFSRYLLHDFEIQEKRLLDGSLALTVSGFTNRVEVMDYFYGLRENPHFFGFERITDNIVCLSASNTSKFYLSGLVKDYIEFFEKYYLQHADKTELEKVMLKEEAKEEAPADIKTLKPEDTPADKEVTEAIPTAESQTEEKSVQENTTSQTTAEKQSNDKVEKEIAAVVPPAKEVTTETPVTTQSEEAAEAVSAEPETPSIYAQTTDEKHSVLVIVKKTRIDYNKLQKSFASHTRNNFGTDKKVQLIDLGATHRMVQIDGFANADEAKAYIKSMEKYPYLTRDIVRKEHYIWAISESNLKKLNETVDIEAYDTFFKANY
ncbi:tetratricopeptide repeat protein [Carboxylicivirga sp. A043]|uniref:type IX secretion system periplasmic lipoprotein PorW/SprE n=1 Tax=Carboxylicivirga litoralis TaxID=2816963 RepID=UPI0021CB91A2|nr:tetratricopeptide repeat protein [Carboxylicivirga sp. A043]MCU4157899.1 tetratricopeptide repeat protein [Carboxylicivirga sp. A043]